MRRRRDEIWVTKQVPPILVRGVVKVGVCLIRGPEIDRKFAVRGFVSAEDHAIIIGPLLDVARDSPASHRAGYADELVPYIVVDVQILCVFVPIERFMVSIRTTINIHSVESILDAIGI